ncbi:MAG: VirB3 family type IV secretion system protein [Betaproteobacteria bacterium]|nr:VirB3 family type IV secretion system protein [Betaproteobacteria bacterium]
MSVRSGERRSTPCYRCLWEPLLIAGVEKPFAIVNITLAIALVGDLHFWGWLPVALLFHLFMRQITAEDPWVRRIYVRYNQQADAYDPWANPRQRRGRRPDGMGYGVMA